MLAHDAENNGETQTRSHAHRFGGEKGIEDARLDGLGDARPAVLDFQKYAAVVDSSRAQANHAVLALLLKGVPGIAQQIDQHLLELPRIGLDEGERGVEVEFETDFLRGQSKMLKFCGAHDHLIQGNQPPFGNGIARIRTQLPPYADGAFRLLINHSRTPPWMLRASSRQRSANCAGSTA